MAEEQAEEEGQQEDANVAMALAGEIMSVLQDPDASRLLDVHLTRFQRACGPGMTERELGEILVMVTDAEAELLLQLCQTPSPAGKTAEAVRWLLTAEADPNVSTAELQESPLALAVRATPPTSGNGEPPEATVDLAAALLAARADANSTDGQGDTPLMEAVLAGSAPLCKLLLDAKADPSHRSNTGATAASFAEIPEVVDLLAGHIGHGSATAAARKAEEERPAAEAAEAARKSEEKRLAAKAAETHILV